MEEKKEKADSSSISLNHKRALMAFIVIIGMTIVLLIIARFILT